MRKRRTDTEAPDASSGAGAEVPPVASRATGQAVSTRARAELVSELLRRIGEGASLRAAADAVGLSFSTAQGWLTADPETREQYAAAQVERARTIAESALTIADGTDELSRAYREVAEQLVAAADPKVAGALARSLEAARVQRDKLRIDARKWFAARMDPKRWGDRVDVTSGGERIAGAVVLPAEAWGVVAVGASSGAVAAGVAVTSAAPRDGKRAALEGGAITQQATGEG